ncbi:acetyl-CoA acyltransferase [Chromobacterium alkanivorans]|uniref:3-oxoadipyl-CoA thiolase n=1 Tax=Chromobacterium TaxID=535 RepID=UPI000653A761|nr:MULTISPECIES: 3-oxoadipyl-CoA thiolase [Chromobacterium]KMN83054.1 beta-ketoadipyl CoA thiolase [Chromobacterium sp. LK11]MBN3002441.1 3-oxoadipyl-CoA thiolase [Chromobacterium alkanivorans]MCS3802919.1 acetyl-CoA acyltransferase [Chromobacterium alkanivorans]MCS3817245.1 acetyl-CoA acyltransferase [Chromobacterium alkanivorans]MCS3872285.1 acetyl-CoA acyltransferase [Chromobacterium alkanivorans]
MPHAYLCDGIRTPFGRYGGALSGVRADDLAALPLAALMRRHPQLDWSCLDEVILGCANQAGEDNRNVARMAALLAGLPQSTPALTVNRLCASGLDAVGLAARAIAAGEAELALAGGVESMSRAPFVMGKADSPFARSARIEDSTIGWRFVNPAFQSQFGIDSMPETAENVARQFDISRADQDAFALRSQQRYAAARERGFFDAEILALELPQRKGEPLRVSQDEHPRPATTLAELARLKGVVADGSVTAGNASGVNDGAAALLLASGAGLKRHGLRPRARILGMCSVGLEPRIMGMGPAPAAEKLLRRLGLSVADLDVIELNEAFASQSLAVLRQLGLDDDDARVNPNGGAIALGHPLGASGARLALTALRQLEASGDRLALCAMCVGVGQGVALVLERVEEA